MPLWRHKNRGTVYRNVETGAIYIRPTQEFMDGRFEQMPEESI